MSINNTVKVALIGNPNTGKTSLFNQLTGLKQKVGNYPGITVDKKQGFCKLNETTKAVITDLPGTYSINPTSMDETLVLDSLLNEKNDTFPDAIVVVVDIENIKRNLLLFTQIKDLRIPTILVINMVDQMDRKGIKINVPLLETQLKTKIVLASARKRIGIEQIKAAILDYKNLNTAPISNITDRIDKDYFTNLKNAFKEFPLYKSWLLITQIQEFDFLSNQQKALVLKFREDISCIKRYQHKETILRYQIINDILKESFIVDTSKASDLRGILDRILTHKIFGYVIFALILLFIFQGIFEWASYPMDLIDTAFASLSSWVKTVMPPGTFTNLIAEGIIPGIGGVIIFIPQIAILFTFISILEETGYMSRVVFLMDKIMRKFGMSGKSVIPLISGTACAIPAIMASRNINSWKERLITILVVPFTTCSARLPVYAILIALVIPNKAVFGILNLQGLTMMALYLLGFTAAIASSILLHKVLKINTKSLFVIEMPNYKIPSLKNIFYEVIEKTKAFIFGAGKIILALSIVLWFLASNGPDTFKNAEQTITSNIKNKDISTKELQKKIASYKLENSYIGHMGKTIEPIIKPMGYDWKIGIALISSFAAREVFVGALATIYNVDSDGENASTIKQRMSAEINTETGEKRFNIPTGISLLLFYAFAMQCIGTLAIVKRETNSWKWPLLQLVGMGILAYISAFLAFNILS
ncbi:MULTISPECIES: ferrous iron transport protein B [Flavobacteriaceae]|uniref:Ferrous iron transport protein B n=2 Tax=Flavobacteriaceae TaxID=49546 RepID=A0A4Y8APT9_9FLAO|nr:MULTISPECIES: ferrous iron transport protein B [Flavobacteriaceae]TEW72615.1 ferrous iron transport protein B [Gramella jeungdoensis]GGK54269.1 ferrous iron transport protein B [Lutibacter litoralis]